MVCARHCAKPLRYNDVEKQMEPCSEQFYGLLWGEKYQSYTAIALRHS